MATINFEKCIKNCLGTMNFVCKFGKMKKVQEFCTYPINKDNTKILLQSSHRWVEISNEGKVMMSAHRNQYANSWSLIEDRIKGKAEKAVKYILNEN